MQDFAIVQWGPQGAPSPLLLGWDVVWCKGTFYRQDAIRAVMRTLLPLGVTSLDIRTFAWLVLEPQNPHDPNACAVYLAQHHVGYLPRELAALMAPKLASLLGLRWFDGRPVGPASCIASIQVADDGARTVGLVGPWPQPSPPPRQAPDPLVEKANQIVAAAAERRSRALDRIKKGMTREELVAALGEEPGKVDEKMTKKCAKHTLYFFEDYDHEGRYELKVSLEDGIVAEWSGTRY